jgi:hypothetical protein
LAVAPLEATVTIEIVAGDHVASVTAHGVHLGALVAASGRTRSVRAALCGPTTLGAPPLQTPIGIEVTAFDRALTVFGTPDRASLGTRFVGTTRQALALRTLGIGAASLWLTPLQAAVVIEVRATAKASVDALGQALVGTLIGATSSVRDVLDIGIAKVELSIIRRARIVRARNHDRCNHQQRNYIANSCELHKNPIGMT